MMCQKFQKLLEQVQWVTPYRKGLGDFHDAAEFLEKITSGIVEDFIKVIFYFKIIPYCQFIAAFINL